MSLKKILISGIWVSIGIMLGRIAGFFREATIANTFGVSSTADVVILSLTIPDLMVNILVAGGLSAALIPEFKSHTNRMAGVLFLQSSVLTGIVFSFVTFFLVYFSNELVMMFAPGFDAVTAEKANDVLAFVLWLIPLTVLAGVSTAYLQSKGQFAIPAMGTLIFNLCLVFGLIFYVADEKDLDIFVWFVLLGGVIRWFSQIFRLKGNFYLNGFWKKWLIHKSLFKRYLQAVLALGILTLYPVIARAFASFQGEGGIAMTNYALKLVELPLGVVITVLSVVLFPKLAAAHKRDDQKGFSMMVEEGIFWSVILAVIIMVCIYSAADSFIYLVYGWGDIDADHLSDISSVLSIAILSLPFQAVIAMLVATCNAKKNTSMPLKASLIGLVGLLILCWIFEKSFGLDGVVIALVISYLVVMFSLFIIKDQKKIYANLDFSSVLRKLTASGLFSVLFIMGVMSLVQESLNQHFLIVLIEIILSMLLLVGIVYMNPAYRQHFLRLIGK